MHNEKYTLLPLSITYITPFSCWALNSLRIFYSLTQTQFGKEKKYMCCIKILQSLFSVPRKHSTVSWPPIHSATPDTVFSAPLSPQSSHFSSFWFSPPSVSPSPLPLPWPSSALRLSAPAGHPQRLTVSVHSAAVSTWCPLKGEKGLRRRSGGDEGPGGGEGGGHAASCDRGHRPLQSCT